MSNDMTNTSKPDPAAEPLALRSNDLLGRAPTRAEVDALMKRCQIGVGGRHALDNAHSIMAECYGALGRQQREIDDLRAQVEAWRKHCDTLTHQVICCGVAASHPDPTLTTRGAYAGKWNSAQAEEVRKLRAERDALKA